MDGRRVSGSVLAGLRSAAMDPTVVKGLTHRFYRYPARFSPTFVSSAIELFSHPGQIVLDPYMGGGTSIVESYARRRVAIGCDLNSLAVFVTRAKVTPLNATESYLAKTWAESVVPTLSYRAISDEVASLICPTRTGNLSLPQARPTKKFIALAILSLREIPSANAQNFIRAVLLNVAQWALNNREVVPSLSEVRERILSECSAMLNGLRELDAAANPDGWQTPRPILLHGTAATLPRQEPFISGVKANLVVTSPPYPGIHILYHRWQVGGTRETPAPYWIADCLDGEGSAYYNFADRRDESDDRYFAESLRTLRAIRSVMADGATIVQLIAFSKPRRQLARYLGNMSDAGFEEVRAVEGEYSTRKFRRIWRTVPGRVWYAARKGRTPSSREVVLIHRAR